MLPEQKGRPLSSTFFRVLIAAICVYILVALMLGLLQRRLIYLPSRASLDTLEQLARREGLVPWRDATGALIGWKTPVSAENRIVVFHGNAGYALHRTYYARGLLSVPGGESEWQVHLFEYPGYGSRGGRPGREAFIAAGQEAIDELLEEGRPVYLCGESIGTGVACALAAKNAGSIDGLLLVAPFTTLADVAARHVPLFPVRRLLRERYDNVEALKAYRGRAAVLLAGRDEVIPRELGEELYGGYGGPKQVWVQPGATHNTLDMSAENPWWREASEFLLED